MSPRVLFVSKPVVAPFHDGTKCLVRDVAAHLERVTPLVMATPGAAPIAPHVEMLSVYRQPGKFTPSLAENVRAAAYLAARARADVWHFVFAPNPKSSAVGRVLRRLRRVPVVQTVASPPRDFSRAAALLFGDVIVAQSRHTRERLLEAERGRERRIEVIPPPVEEIAPRATSQRQAVRARLALPDDAVVFTYPGDIEMGGGAEAVAAVVETLARELPRAVVVFAYREKTARAGEVANALERGLPARHVRFASSLGDVLALVEESAAVLFPVSDLWGKVDQPIVLLESMMLGVPVIALDKGPLAELGGVVHVAPGDRRALVRAALELAIDPARRAAVVEAQATAVRAENLASRVARRYEDLYLELCR
jgi:glycosyltransferase involved in cell wall biosynthesis